MVRSADDIRAEIIRLNNLYRAGTPEVSDEEYDIIVENFFIEFPDDELFKSGVIEQATDRMEDLPVPMYSLEKVKEIKEIRAWLTKMKNSGCKRIVVTPKFDGISLVVNEHQQQAWTRGDGVQGQRSDKHFDAMRKGLSFDLDYIQGNLPEKITWGEAICSKSAFNYAVNHGAQYKNARNMVAGLFNSPIGYANEAINSVTYVRYGYNDDRLDKVEQLHTLDRLFGNTARHEVYWVEDLLMFDESNLIGLLNQIYHDFGEQYRIDGLVLDVNEAEVRKVLGRLSNNNPAYAVAVKREEWAVGYLTEVTSVQWGVSKDGILNPVIHVQPVEMDGATVSRVTGYNAKYMIENHIAVGSKIEIVRSGDVIPKHIRTESWKSGNQIESHKMVCPSCDCQVLWDDTHTDLVCSNPYCKEKNISRIVYFFRTMGCEGFDDPTIRRMYENGYHCIVSLLCLQTEDWQNVFGQKRGLLIGEEIQRMKSRERGLAQVMTARNMFKGVIGEKVAQLILDNEPAIACLVASGEKIDNDLANALVGELCLIKGVGRESAWAFVRGLADFNRDNSGFWEQFYTYISTPQKRVADNQMFVCMTGFRSAVLEEALKNQGHEVLSGVTGKCTVLVVADLNSKSSKMQKAQKMGIRIVDRKTFEDEVLLQR